MAPAKRWIEIPLKDQDAKPVPMISYHITIPDRPIK
jgi:hypothetical protein